MPWGPYDVIPRGCVNEGGEPDEPPEETEYEIDSDDEPSPHPYYTPLAWAALPYEARDRIARARGWRKL